MEVLLLDEALDPVFLRLGLNGDRVHAELPAVVPRALPVPLGVLTNSQPGKVIILVESGRVDFPLQQTLKSLTSKYFNILRRKVTDYIHCNNALIAEHTSLITLIEMTYYFDSCQRQEV